MENRYRPGPEEIRRLTAGIECERAAKFARRLLTKGRVRARADTPAFNSLRAAAVHLIRNNVPVLPGRSTAHELEVVIRGDEQGRLWWSDWKRAIGWKGGPMGRLAPPRNEAELVEMLEHPNPEVRQTVIELIPEIP